MGIDEQVAALEAKERLFAPDKWPVMQYVVLEGLYFYRNQVASVVIKKHPEITGTYSLLVAIEEAKRQKTLDELKSFCQRLLQDGEVTVAAIERYTQAYAKRVMEHILTMYPDLRGESIVVYEDLGIPFSSQREIPDSVTQVTRKNAGLTVALLELYIRNSMTEQQPDR